MSKLKLFYKVQVLVLTFWVSHSYAINLGVTNTIVNPNTVEISSTFSVNGEVFNTSDATNAEISNTIRVTVDNFGIDGGANFSYAGNVVGGWTCTPTGNPVTKVDCVKVIALPIDNMPFLPFGFDLTAGATPIPSVDFNYRVSDDVLTQDVSSFIDTSTVNVSVVSALTGPDIDFVDAVTQAQYNATEGQTSPVLIDYQVTNLGTATTMGASFSIYYDTFSFTYNAGASTVPGIWTCLNGSTSLDCTSNAGAELAGGGVVDFQFAFDTSGFGGNALASGSPYNFTSDLFLGGGMEQITSNNGISTNVVVTAGPSNPDVVIDMEPVSGLINGPKGGLIATKDSTVKYKILANAIDVSIPVVNKNSSNKAAIQATGVVITNTIPTGFTFVGFSDVFGPNFIGACSESVGIVTCNVGDLPITTAIDGVEIQVLVTANVGDFVSPISATVIADNDDNLSNNDEFLQGVSISGVVDIEMKTEAKDLNNIPQTVFAIGENFQYVLTAKNLGPNDADANSVDVYDDIPTGIDITSFTAPAGWDCSGSDLQSNSILCFNTSPFVANSSVNFSIPVSSSIAGQYNNEASASIDLFSNNIETNFTNNTGVVDVEIGLQTSLSVTKEALLSGVPVQSIPKGDAFSYKVAIRNTGSFTATILDLVDDMPSGVSVINAFGTGWTCNNSGLQYSCTFPGTLAPGATTFVEFDVVDISGVGVTQLQNNVTVSALNTPDVAAFNTVQLDSVEYSLNVTQNPVPIEANTPFEFVVDIVNTGATDILGAEVVNVLPDGFSYTAQAKASTCTVNGLMMTCSINNPIAAGTTESIVVGVQAIAAVDANVTYTNITTISGTNIFTPTTVNSVINIGQVGTGAGGFNFTLDIVDDIDPIEINKEFSYIVSMTNTGPSPITMLDVDVGIPSELTINSIVPNGIDCSTASFGLSCISGAAFNLPIGETQALVTVKVQSDSFIGEVLADTFARIGTTLSRNDSETTTIIETIIIDTDLSAVVNNTGAIDQGDVSNFDVQLKNNGPSEAVSPTVSIVTTGILDTVTVDSGNDWTCQVNALTVDCQFNNATMPINHLSTILLTANSTQVVLEEEDIVVTATISSLTTDQDLTNNVATSIVDVTGTPTEGEIGDAIRDAFGGSTGNPQLDSAIDGVSEYCEATFFNGLEGTCDDLYDAALEGDVEAIQEFLEEITPNEVIGQSTSIAEIAGAQFRNVGARLNQVRGGGGRGFSSAGLNARYGNGSIPLGMLAYLDQTEEESKAIDTNNDFISPWGFFVNGTISLGERDATGRELGFDFDTFGLTAGFDYRIDAKKVVGIALGYANFDSEIDNGTAELNSTGITLTGYGSFYVNDNFYLDARISMSNPEFDQSRNINFTIGNSIVDSVATGKTDASQYGVAMSAGYSFYKNAWNITPNASFSYTSTTIDSFTETGAGEFNIIYSEQDIESLIWSAGIRLSKAISLKKGVITPQFDFDYNYESLNDANDIVARFVGSTDQLFIIQTDSPDRTYGSAGLGFVYISTNGKQAYINYRSVLGLEGFSRGTYNIGARFEF